MTTVLAAGLTAGALITGPVPSASADGTFRWQNEGNRGYLMPYNYGTGNDFVITGANSSHNGQWWHDYLLSDNYYALQNAHSNKFLDRWDDGTKRNDPLGRSHIKICGYSWQYDWTGQNWQRWAYRNIWSYHDKRHFSVWINKQGCAGDAYIDALGTDPDYSTMTLWTEDACGSTGENSWYPGTQCWWRRNGQ